ncbi:MAG: S66 family peptidase [Metamycoplasmataceae bacterium]
MFKIKSSCKLIKINDHDKKKIILFFSSSKTNIREIFLSKKEYELFSKADLKQTLPTSKNWEAIIKKLIASDIVQLINSINIGIYNATTPILAHLEQKAKRIESFFNKHNINITWGELSFKNINSYRSGSTIERANEFNKLIDNKKLDIIMPSIGGNNSSSVLPYLDYEKIKQSTTKIIGHSDTTTIVLAIYAKTKKITYYGPSFMVGFDNQDKINQFHLDSLINNCFKDNLGKLTFPKEYTDDFILWENKKSVPNKIMKKNEIICLSPGKVQGVLIGGNLDTFLPLIGTEYFPPINKNTILFFEDTCQNNELTLAQLEKNLSNLKHSGILEKIGGLIIGKCEGFDKISNGIKYYEFLQEFITPFKIPVLANIDIAHTLPIVTVAIGSTIILDASNEKITRIK